MGAPLYIDLSKGFDKPAGKMAGSGKEYEYRPAGPKPGGPGWEATSSGGWKRPKGMGGAQKPSAVEDETKRKVAESPAEKPEAPKVKDTPPGTYTPDDIKPEHKEAAAEHARENLKDPKLADKIEGKEGKKEMSRAEESEEIAQARRQLRGSDKARKQKEAKAAATQKKEEDAAISSALKELAGKQKTKSKEEDAAIKDARKELAGKQKAREKKVSAEAAAKQKEEDAVIKDAQKELKVKQKAREEAKKEEAKAKEKAKKEEAKAKEKAQKEKDKARKKEEDAVIKDARLVLKEKAKKREKAEADAKQAEEEAAQAEEEARLAEEAKQPKSNADFAEVEAHKRKARNAAANLHSHLENNPDIPEEDKKGLYDALNSLIEHSEKGTIPSKDEANELKRMTGAAGEYGKKKFANEEEVAKPPENDQEQAAMDAHNAEVQDLINNAQAHMESSELSEEHKAKLGSSLKVLESMAGSGNVPTKDQINQLKETKKLLGEHAKAPKEGTEAAMGAGADKGEGSSSSSSSLFSGRAAAMGRQFEQGASDTTSGGAELGSMAVTYGAEGAVAAGHHLLKKPKKEDENMGKGLLYLDTTKAISTSSSSSAGDAVSGERGRQRYKESFHRKTSGVSGGYHPTDDDPDVGKRWPEDDEDEREEERQEYKKKQQDAGVVKSSMNSLDMLKSLSDETAAYASRISPRSEEVQFLMEECGFSEEQVMQGRAVIKGSDKQRFNDWMCKRLSNSVNALKRSLF